MYGCIQLRTEEGDAVRLRACAEAFSPQIEVRGSSCVVFDLRGLGKLIGSPADIARAIAGKAGEGANIAVAPNRDAAIAAARGIEGITVILPGQEASILGPLPVDVLEPEEALNDTLLDWGIHTFAQLAALPEKGIAERLGSAGLRLQKRARGFGVQPLLPAIDKPVFQASMELEHPLDLLEPLSFILTRLLGEICGNLQLHGVAANEVDLQLVLEEGEPHHRRLRLPVPSRDAGWFVKLLQYDLSGHPPCASIVAVHVSVEPVQPRRLQNGLFVPQGPQPERLEVTIARLAAAVGEDNIGSPELLDTHRPGAYRMNRFVVQPDWEVRPAAPHLAMRIYRPPLPATVEAPQGKPRALIAKEIRGTVAACAGPWRSSGDWWSGSPWNRDDWDIALQSGALYRIFHEQGKGWFVEGNYD